MTLTLNVVLANASTDLNKTGFLFGAGTSVEAGYPMMNGLTRSVITGLNSFERDTLNAALAATGIIYDDVEAVPNIESIADLVIEHAVNTSDARFGKLEQRLRELVTEVILSVTTPSLDRHVDFMEKLKARCYGRAATVYILTTNYDLLFEYAAAEAGVAIETGFLGSVVRFFDQKRFTTLSGVSTSGRHFQPHSELTVRLIKLHGSLSWTSRSGKVFEQHPSSISPDATRVLVLPRRRKVMDTLQPPYDTLFGVASRTLGTDCKYIASCGFSYGDEHINQALLAPAISRGSCQLFALCAEETDGLTSFKTAPAFSAGFSSGGITNGVAHSTGTECWKFSKFVELFN